MRLEKKHVEINRAAWNNKTAIHLNSEFYAMDNFRNGKNSLNEIELALLGDINRKSILHLQCHFGQDTISLSRLGAKVTGIDLSDEAIKNAKKLATELESDAEFICCNIYDLPQYLNQKFDIVFTSYGTICWLPDLHLWGNIIAQFLKPKGKFIFAEFHPVVWMFDDNFESIAYNYFNDGPIKEIETGTYAAKNAAISQEYIVWNHPLEAVFKGLIENQLEITSFQEFDYSPYNCFNNTIEFEKDKYRIEKLGNKIPMVYAITAVKKQ